MALSEFLTVSVVTEILALIASFLCFGKKDARYLCTLPFYLLFVLSIEFLGYYYHSLKRPNYVFYNFLMLIQAIYFYSIALILKKKEVQLFYYFY